ncbi:MAG: putative DNA-binding domain-containing protein [Lautropia sp.]|nr:putative DNA-binding domain-containing protein [Lautropia sp.]
MADAKHDKTRLSDIQLALKDYLQRNHQPLPNGAAPQGVEAQLAQMRHAMTDIVTRCFPLCRQLIGDEDWKTLLDRFLASDGLHEATHVHQVPRAFIAFLQGPAEAGQLPPWMPELAHYEWIEMEVISATQKAPEYGPQGIALSPRLRLQAYDWPVQQIRPDHVAIAPELSFFAVYQNRAGDIRFSQLSPAAAQMLGILQTNGCDWHRACQKLARQLEVDTAVIVEQTQALKADWIREQLLWEKMAD